MCKDSVIVLLDVRFSKLFFDIGNLVKGRTQWRKVMLYLFDLILLVLEEPQLKGLWCNDGDNTTGPPLAALSSTTDATKSFEAYVQSHLQRARTFGAEIP